MPTITRARGKGLLHELAKAHGEGWLNKQSHASLPLDVYCYSQSTVFEQKWTGITRFARGIVVHRETGEIIGKPFDKFYNSHEKACPALPKKPFISYEKIDGSLISVWYYDGKWNFSTKCSFDNDYTRYAERDTYLFENLPKEFTYICEVVLHPEEDGMKRAVAHAPGLYLLGATDMKTLRDLSPEHFRDKWNGHYPKIYHNSVEELLQQAEAEKETEGWVVRYDNGFRCKIKTAWYLRIFRLISKLDGKVQEQMLAGQSLDEILFETPEELHKDITEYYSLIQEAVEAKVMELDKEYLSIIFNLPHVQIGLDCKPVLAVKEGRKLFAEQAVKSPNSGLLFKIYDGDPNISQLVLKQVIKEHG